ncbi:MAG: AglZ/HisF2 family acetamidino modification protein [Bacteroidota bacterium]
MRRIRVIPVLLMNQGKLEKTVKFKSPKYVGDPINAVRIFNEKEVDELVVLDIGASPLKKAPDFSKVREIAGECFMPLGYGGGIKSLDHASKLFHAGVEKVIINTAVVENPGLVEEIASRYGSQSVVVSIDYKKDLFGKEKVYVKGGRKKTGKNVLEYALEAEKAGAGEIILNSIERDGTFESYDIEMLKRLCPKLNIPVVACGGAGKLSHFKEAVSNGGASAVSAGSLFVFKGIHRAVLINYPDQKMLAEKVFMPLSKEGVTIKLNRTWNQQT